MFEFFLKCLFEVLRFLVPRRVPPHRNPGREQGRGTSARVVSLPVWGAWGSRCNAVLTPHHNKSVVSGFGVVSLRARPSARKRHERSWWEHLCLRPATRPQTRAFFRPGFRPGLPLAKTLTESKNCVCYYLFQIGRRSRLVCRCGR